MRASRRNAPSLASHLTLLGRPFPPLVRELSPKISVNKCTAWRWAPRSRQRPVVRQLGNGRAVPGGGRRVRQHLRGTRTHARASTRANAPTVHTPTHISTALHKHDHCTFLHLPADLCISQRCERARRALQGKARPGGTDPATSRAAERPTTTTTPGIKALCIGFAVCRQERCRASAVELRRAACFNRAMKAAHARPQHARMRQRRAGAHGAAASSGCHAAWATVSIPHVNPRVKPCNPGRPGSSLWFESRTRQHRGST